MKNTKIKVADLLIESHQEDNFSFDEIMIDIEGLKKPGIKGDIFLSSFNHDTIEAEFTNISCSRAQTCEKCSKDFIKSIWCDSYETTFTNNKETLEDENDADLFMIDDNKNIDMEESLRQAIGVQSPITTLCYDCINEEPSGDDDDNVEYYEATNNIKFH